MSQKIKVLSDIEHVLQVPSRYIGTTTLTTTELYTLDKNETFIKKEVSYIPAILTLFREALTNSIDEFIKTNGKFADKISVNVDDKNITVEDNGRGLPHEIEEVTGLPQSVVAFTKLKAGSNFTDDSSSIGMHGEGISLANVFSKKFEVETSNGEYKTNLVCTNNLSTTDYNLKKCKQHYTKVSFDLDIERFNISLIDDTHINLINKIIYDMSLCYPEIKFKFNNKTIKCKNFQSYINMFNSNNITFTYENVDIALISAEDYEQISWVNGIFTRRGGYHVDLVSTNVINAIRQIIGKKYKDIKPADIKNKLLFIINVRNMVKPRFDSQTKEELIKNDNCSDLFNDIDYEKIAKKVKTNKEIFDNITEAYKIKEELKKRQLLNKKEKKLEKINVPKLIESYTKNRNDCRLYIAEGKSALSRFVTCRNKDYAGYPLKGKFINVNDKSRNIILKNGEVNDILSCTGLRLTDQSIDDLRYGKIVIFTDQDYDGDSICSLLILFFYKYWPELFKQGKIYRAVSPIIKAKNINTKELSYFYTVQEYNTACKNEQYEIIDYNKGLGSLEKDEYKKALETLIKIEFDDKSEESLEIAFGKDTQKRKDWLLEK